MTGPVRKIQTLWTSYRPPFERKFQILFQYNPMVLISSLFQCCFANWKTLLFLILAGLAAKLWRPGLEVSVPRQGKDGRKRLSAFKADSVHEGLERNRRVLRFRVARESVGHVYCAFRRQRYSSLHLRFGRVRRHGRIRSLEQVLEGHTGSVWHLLGVPILSLKKKRKASSNASGILSCAA